MPATEEVRETFTDRLVFVDCETGSLEINGTVWEVAVGTYTKLGQHRIVSTFVVPDIATCNVESLAFGGFAHRYNAHRAITPGHLLGWLRDYIAAGSTIVGSNPWFDMAQLEAATQIVDPRALPWKYHPVDVPSLVAGRLETWPSDGESFGLRWCADVLQLDVSDLELHTASDDVELAMRIYDELWNV